MSFSKKTPQNQLAAVASSTLYYNPLFDDNITTDEENVNDDDDNEYYDDDDLEETMGEKAARSSRMRLSGLGKYGIGFVKKSNSSSNTQFNTESLSKKWTEKPPLPVKKTNPPRKYTTPAKEPNTPLNEYIEQLLDFAPPTTFYHQEKSKIAAKYIDKKNDHNNQDDSELFQKPFHKTYKMFSLGKLSERKDYDKKNTTAAATTNTAASRLIGGKSIFSQRNSARIGVLNALKHINIPQFKACLSGAKSLKTKLDRLNILHMGTFSNVYEATYRNAKFIIKESLMTPREEFNIISNNKRHIPLSSHSVEYKMLSLAQELILSYKSPNFLYVYNTTICNQCLDSEMCYLTFMEAATSNLANTIRSNNLPFDVYLSILYQILLGIHAIHSEYGIVHGNISLSNILVKVVPAGGLIKYNCKNAGTFLVENNGFLVLISDFSAADSLKPQFSQSGIYGHRNTYFNKYTELLEPVNITSNKAIKWIGTKAASNGTDNKFGYKNSSQAHRHQIDLNDTVTWPPQEFLVDIFDCLNMFVGGRRMMLDDEDNDGTHHKHLENINHKFYDLIMTQYQDVFTYKQTSLRYLNASYMVKQLYKKSYSNVSNYYYTHGEFFLK